MPQRDLPRFRRFNIASPIARHRFRCVPEPWIVEDGTFADLEDMLAFAPEFRLGGPMDATLDFRFAGRDSLPGERGLSDPASIVRRLRTGSPFRRVVFHAPDHAAAEAVTAASGIRPIVINTEAAASDAASVICPAFGPIALHISAFWGDGGAHRIHAAQVRHLVERGYYVFRIFIDHNPVEEAEGRERYRRMRRECLGDAFGHADTLVVRDTSAVAHSQIHAPGFFDRASPVGRVTEILSGALLLDPNAVAWAGTRAAIAIVNHVVHTGFAERITRAPIVLETHDLCADLYDVHGVPHFVPPAPDGPALRAADEAAIWSRAAACVNLSPADHAVVSRHVPIAELVRPAPGPQAGRRRPWPEVARANALSARIAEAGRIDVLLWGSLHQGNVDSTAWFLEHVVPANAALAAATIVLAGRMTLEIPAALMQRPNVVVLGHVDRIEDFLAHAAVLVIPDRAGSGISIKLMDALVSGRPFAAMAAAMRGIDLGDSAYRGCATPAELATDIGALLQNPTLRQQRAALATALSTRNYSTSAHAAAWDRILAAVPRETPHLSGIGIAPESKFPPPGRPAVAPELSVVVCTYDRAELLDQCLMSLLDQSAPEAAYEIIVVDNSPDQAAAAANARRYETSRVRYLLEPIAGLSNARNVGVRAARAPLVAFIDDDGLATRNWIEAAIDAMRRKPDATAAGGRILPFWAFDRPLWLHDDLLGFLSQVDWRGRLRPLAAGEWLAAGNLVLRRQDAIDAGLFPERLGRNGPDRTLMSNEENDLFERLRKRGKTILYAPDMCIEHWIHAERITPTWIRRRIAWQAISDFVSEAPGASESSNEYARRLQHFHFTYPDARPGEFVATDDPNRFRDEATTIYNAMMSLLVGGAPRLAERPADPAPAPPRTGLAALVDRVFGRHRRRG